MQHLLAIVATLFTAMSVFAVEWCSIEEDNWRSGPTLSPEKLKGKVVLVCRWDANHEQSIESLPHVEALWKEFRKRPFAVIGSYRTDDTRKKIIKIVLNNELTYSIYLNARLVDEPSTSDVPFYYLVSPYGEVIHQGSGFSEPEMGELKSAVSNALAVVSAPGSLCGDVKVTHFKKEAAKLVRWKNAEAVVARLKSFASKKGPKAEEARAILDSVEHTRNAIKDEIRSNVKLRPGLALVRLETLVNTWPSEKEHCSKILNKLAESSDVEAAANLRRALIPEDGKKQKGGKNAAANAAMPFLRSKFPGVAREIAELLVACDHIACENVPDININFETPIIIIGDGKFIEKTKDALSLIEKGSPDIYEMVTNYISVIRCGRTSGMDAKRPLPTFRVGTTADSNLHWYASTIVHDANHSKLYNDHLNKFGGPVPSNIWTGREAENSCLSVQEEFLKAIHASNNKIKHVRKMRNVDYFSSKVKRTW